MGFPYPQNYFVFTRKDQLTGVLFQVTTMTVTLFQECIALPQSQLLMVVF